jgi:mRNA interferase MazF
MNMSVSVKENIGHIINYKYLDKNSIKNKYFIECFVCEYVKDEDNEKPEGEILWLTVPEGIKVLSDQYKKLEINLENSSTLFNLKTHIIFLKEYRSLIIFRQKNFDIWNIEKKIVAEKTDNDLEDFYFREREVWWCKMGVNVGYEQDGKGKDFLRPVLVIKKLNKFTFLGVPLSSVIKNENNRLKVNIILKDKTEAVNDALINQIKIFDVRRIKYQLGTVKEKEFVLIKKSIRDIFV